MAKITRTDKASIDTDGDNSNDVIISVIPKEPISVQHANDAVYTVQVENQRSDASLRFRKRHFDKHGDEYYVEMPLIIGPGQRNDLETVKFHDEGPRHPQINLQRIEKKVKYMLLAGSGCGIPQEITLIADCNDSAGGDGMAPPGEREGKSVYHLGHLRIEVSVEDTNT